MTRFLKALIGVIFSVVFLVGCSKSDEPSKDQGGNNTGNNGSTVTQAVSDPGSQTGQITQAIGKDVDISNLDEATLKNYPEEKKPSMYFYNAKEISDEVFFKEPEEEIGGDPYIIKGIILEDFDNIDSALDLTEHGQLLKGMDVNTKGFKVMTNLGQVMLVDVLPYNAQSMRDDAGKDVYTFQYYNCLFNNLSLYKTYPEVGDAGRFYGFYMGYDEANDCPVFTYGVSALARAAFFPADYVKYHSEETKHYKYRNYIEFDYPVGWSEPFEAGSEKDIYFGGNLGVFGIMDYEMEDMSLDDAVDMMIAQYTGEGYEDYWDEEYDEDLDEITAEFVNAPMFKLYDHEYITVGKDNDIRGHVFRISRFVNDSYWEDEDVYIIQSKKVLVAIYKIYFIRRSLDEPDAPIPADAEYNDVYELNEEEFDKVLKSIKLCGY